MVGWRHRVARQPSPRASIYLCVVAEEHVLRNQVVAGVTGWTPPEWRPVLGELLRCLAYKRTTTTN